MHKLTALALTICTLLAAGACSKDETHFLVGGTVNLGQSSANSEVRAALAWDDFDGNLVFQALLADKPVQTDASGHALVTFTPVETPPNEALFDLKQQDPSLDGQLGFAWLVACVDDNGNNACDADDPLLAFSTTHMMLYGIGLNQTTLNAVFADMIGPTNSELLLNDGYWLARWLCGDFDKAQTTIIEPELVANENVVLVPEEDFASNACP